MGGAWSLLQNLKIHIESVHEGVVYSCDRCSYQGKDRKYLDIHKKRNHEGIVFSCSQCDYRARQISKLKSHQEAKHEGKANRCHVFSSPGSIWLVWLVVFHLMI